MQIANGTASTINPPNGPTQHIKLTKPNVFIGSAVRGPSDGPIEISAHRAAELVKQGIAQIVTPIQISEVRNAASTAPSKAERATARKA